MNVLPVIDRELRSQARQVMTYWMRLMAAGILIVVFWLGIKAGHFMQPALLGSELFQALNGAVYYLIWLGVPMLVADAISREKREGTLGLLFLTPLAASDVVLGKGAILGVRATGLLVAGLPVLILPGLLGGVSWRNVVFMVGSHGLSLVCALAAGLTASALSRRFLRAVIGAVLLSGLVSIVFNTGVSLLFGGREEAILFGPLALIEGMEGMDRWPVGRTWWWLGLPPLVLLGLAAALVGRVIRQVEEFWQDDPLTTGRARLAAAAWWRLLARLAVVAVLVLVGAAVSLDGLGGAHFVLGASSVCLSLSIWLGGSGWVVQRWVEEAESEQVAPARVHFGAGAMRLPAASGAGRGWWRPVRGAWAFLVAGAFALFISLAALTGVVTGWQVGVLCLAHGSAAMLTFGGAALAWGWGRSWARAMLRLGVVLVPLFLAWCFASGLVIMHVEAVSTPGFRAQDPWGEPWWHWVMGGALVGSGAWLGFGIEPFLRYDWRVWLLDSLLVFLGSAFVSLALWWVAQRLERRPLRATLDDPARAVAEDLAEPLFARAFFRRRRRRLLNRNPMRWLLERSRLARLNRSAWLALVAAGEVYMCTSTAFLSAMEIHAWNSFFLLVMSLGLAVAAGMSFQEEKRTGALELILVTPLSVWRIIGGRWRGLIGQFVPAISLMVGVSAAAHSIGYRYGLGRLPVIAAVAAAAGLGSFLSVPLVGMVCSIRLRTVAAGWVCTLAVPVANVLLAVGFLYLPRAGPFADDLAFWISLSVGGAVLFLLNLALAAGALRVLVRSFRGGVVVGVDG